MGAIRATILGAALLLAAPSYAGDDDPDAIRTRLRAAVPTSALPVTGTVGEVPEGALEIGILADGTYLCDGRECGHDELEAALRRHADAGKRSEIGESELALVLRVDRETPWPLVHWCLLICGAPNVGIYRTYFAIAPEAGGPEGVLDCFLPASGSLRMPSKVPALEVRVAADTETADQGAVFAAMKAVLDASEARTWDLLVSSPSPLVLRTGHLLTLMDLGWRAGARTVWFGGVRAGRRRGVEADIPGIRGSVEWFRAYASSLRRDVPAGLKVRIAGLPLARGPQTGGVPLPSPPPRGRLAVRPPYEGPPWPEDLEEDPWASGSQPPPIAQPKHPAATPPTDSPATRVRAAIPREDLPRTGIVFDAPVNPIVIGIAADGSILVDGTPGGLPELATALKTHAQDPSMREPEHRGMKTNVILRASAAVPWPVVAWVMQTCDAFGFQRLSFAVNPESGGDEGVIDAFLPRHLGIVSGGAPWDEKPQVKVALFAADAPIDAAGTLAALKAAIAGRVEVRVRIETPYPKVPLTGHVLTMLDLSRRAGAVDVTFLPAESPRSMQRIRDRGAAADPNEVESLPWIRAWVRERLRWGKSGLMVKLDSKRIEGLSEGKGSPLPSPPPRERFPSRPLPFPSAEPEEEYPEDLRVPDTSSPPVAPAPKPK